MNILRTSSHTLLAGLAVIALAACSKGPSAGDMKQAVSNNQTLRMQLSMMLKAGSAFGAPSGMSANDFINIMEIERGDCAEASGQTGFVCDFRMNATIEGERREGQWIKARFFIAGGWQIEQMR